MRRFFFHYRKHDGLMTVHFRNVCHIATEVRCLVPRETHRNNRQPRLVMRGFAKEVTVTGGVATISGATKQRAVA